MVKDGTSGIFGKKVWLRYVILCQFYTPLNMEENKVHFRHLMLFFYRKGKNVTHTANEICVVYGEGAVTDRTVRKWFASFIAGDFRLKFQERSDRPSTTKWIIYSNVERKRSCGKRNDQPLEITKVGLHPMKVLLCVCWD